MNGVFPIERTVFAQFKLSLRILAVFHRRIIFPFAFRTLQRNDFNSTFLFTRHNISSRQITLSTARAPVQNRTADLNLTMVALYRLSYKGKRVL